MRLFFRRQSDNPARRRPAPRHPLRTFVEPRDESYTFQRGRTITGSVSSYVRSTNEAQADLKSPRVHLHDLKKVRRQLSVILLLAVILSVAVLTLIGQLSAKVIVQATPEATLQLDSSYVEAINQYLSDHPIQRWRPLLNIDQLTDYLHNVTPEVRSVEAMGFAGLGVARFSIELRAPIASWDIDGKRLYVDESGMPFGRNYFNPPELVVTDQSGIPVTPGQTVTSNRFMGLIGQVIGRAKAQGYTVTGVVIPSGMTRQFEVRLDGVGYPIKFSSDRGAGEGVEDMIRAVRWMAARKVSPEYIDVRVSGKVFYR